MRLCQYPNCPNWAQWRATWPDKTRKILCNIHKESIQPINKDLPEDERVKFVFVGAVPDNIDERIH